MTSVPYTNSRAGHDWSARGGDGVEVSGDSLRLTPSDALFSWARWRMATDGRPVISAGAELEIASGEAWIGLSHYASGAWEFHGPLGTDAHTFEIDASYVSSNNNVYVLVVVERGSDAFVHAATLTVDQPGWGTYTIEDAGNVGLFVEMKLHDGRPMLVYTRESDRQVRFARAAVPVPHEASDWQTMTIDFRTAPERMVGPHDITVIDGRPAVLYKEDEEDFLYYAYAAVAEPSGFEDWVQSPIYDTDYILHQVSLCEIYDTPRVLFIDGSGPVILGYSAVSNPEPGDWTFTAVTNDELGLRHVAMTVSGYKLAAVMQARVDDELGLYFAEASGSTPAGPEDWSFSQIRSYTAGVEHISIVMKPSKPTAQPMVAYCSGLSRDELSVARATVEWPNGPDDWIQCYFGNRVKASDVGTADAHPFVAYNNTFEGRIMVAMSPTSFPGSTTEWEFSALEQGVGDSLTYISVAAVGNTPLVAFYHPVERSLKFSYYAGE